MSLIFNVSYQWPAPFKLYTIDIRNCSIGPSFPAWLQSQTELLTATLSNTNISDSIPEELFLKSCVQIEYLDLSYNRIHGRLPLQMTCPSLYHIDLSHNRFAGPFPLLSANLSLLNFESSLFSGLIPSQFGQLMPELRELYLSENQLNGTIPASMCNMTNLAILTLRTNQFYGEFPEAWSLWSNILVIDVGYNNLSGHIPISMGVPSSRAILKLNNNNFGGTFPSLIFENCTNLKSVDLGSNKFIGDLPSMMSQNCSSCGYDPTFSGGIYPNTCAVFPCFMS
uniref:probable leucine-rich repeat receptor-like protein kinase At5g63930 n=1 Tax=Fragaria vesca subsp. vesca TaxID=101020 RepID=UPI0005C85AE9|nr:PREDICTED: probable leucine-rich repeat receptor-like protein kinase At5g63930 [Fragaria vesca subsp. vesca]